VNVLAVLDTHFILKGHNTFGRMPLHHPHPSTEPESSQTYRLPWGDERTPNQSPRERQRNQVFNEPFPAKSRKPATTERNQYANADDGLGRGEVRRFIGFVPSEGGWRRELDGLERFR